MYRLEFRGHSDDTAEYTLYQILYDRNTGAAISTTVISEDSHEDLARGTIRTFQVDAGPDGVMGRVCVDMFYGPRSTWSIGISPVSEEDDGFPWWAWPKWMKDGYTPVMSFDINSNEVKVSLVSVDGKPYKAQF